MHDLVLRGVTVPGNAAPVDIAIDEGIITVLGTVASPAREELRLDGRPAVAGLWDAHVHFGQWARTRGRLDVSAATSVAHACALVRDAAPAGMLVGFGFRWAGWQETPTADALDEARVAPTVLLSGDLHSVWVGTAAARDLGCRAGLLREDEAFAVIRALDTAPVPRAALASAMEAAASRGVVGIVDLEFADNAELWGGRIANGLDSLRVRAGFYPDLLDARLAAGVRSGAAVAGTRGLLTHGSLKVITDGSLNTRTAHCLDPYPDGGYGMQNVAPEDLQTMMAAAARGGIDCAIHALGDAATAIALDAFAATGAGGTIEHAQLIAPADIPRFASLGVSASVQPEHAMDDRDVAERLWPGRTHRAFALRSLLDAGARVVLGSDAPVAPLDPWVAIASAVYRTRDSREPWNAAESITVGEALEASTRSRLAVGQVGDVVVLDADLAGAGAAAIRAMPVALTVLGGRITHAA